MPVPSIGGVEEGVIEGIGEDFGVTVPVGVRIAFWAERSALIICFDFKFSIVCASKVGVIGTIFIALSWEIVESTDEW